MKQQPNLEVMAKHANQSESSIQICIAAQDWEKDRIYRFRYQVFIEEISKHLSSVDHHNKRITDAMDNYSILLYAEANSDIVGTMRVTIADVDQFSDQLINIFAMHKFKAILRDYPSQKLGLTTKFAIADNYRGSTVMYQLVVESFKLFQRNNVQFAFGGNNPHLISLYERVGYRRFTKNFTDPGYGLLIPIVIIMHDSNYLQKVRSPFYRIARKKPHDAELVRRFEQAFPEAARHINTRLTSAADLWNYIQAKLAGTELTSLPVFKNLTAADCLSLLQLGAIFPCTDGDCIISSGDMVNDLYFLLSGAVVSDSPAGSALLRPGQCFGGGLTGPIVYPATITAVTDSEIMVIPRQAFEKFNQLHPAPAAAFLTNITALAGLTGGNNAATGLSQA